jgi:hypothetical protein
MLDMLVKLQMEMSFIFASLRFRFCAELLITSANNFATLLDHVAVHNVQSYEDDVSTSTCG